MALQVLYESGVADRVDRGTLVAATAPGPPIKTDGALYRGAVNPRVD